MSPAGKKIVIFRKTECEGAYSVIVTLGFYANKYLYLASIFNFFIHS